jgi:hypothetical protein
MNEPRLQLPRPIKPHRINDRRVMSLLAQTGLLHLQEVIVRQGLDDYPTLQRFTLEEFVSSGISEYYAQILMAAIHGN